MYGEIANDHSNGIPVGKDLGRVQHISFSLTDRLITACIGKEIWVLNIQVSGTLWSGKLIVVMSGYKWLTVNI